MTTHTYTFRSRPAIGLGVFFAGIAAWVLLWDLRSLGDLTTDHVQAIAALAGTITAGHFSVSAARQHLYVWALVLGVAACVGTGVCILGSAGRGAEVVERRAASANQSNDVRRDALAELSKARLRRDELADQFARECSSGRKDRCNGIKFALDSADSHAAILQVRADAAAPEQVANIKIKHAARMLAFFLGFNQSRAEEGLELLWPVALPLVNELLSIAFFGIGFGHRKVVVISPPARLALPAPQLPDRLPMVSEEAAVLAALDRANRPVSNEELALLLQVSPGESSKRARILEIAGKVTRKRAGRYVEIARA